MRRYDVVDTTWVDVDDDHDDLSEYARPNTRTEHCVEGIREAKNGDLITDMDLKVDDSAYLVYVIYSSGDSFGHDSGKHLTPIHLFDSEEKAHACVKAINEHYRNNDPNGPAEVRWTVNFTGNDGSIQSEYAGWVGYFESIDEVTAELVTVLPEIKRTRRF